MHELPHGHPFEHCGFARCAGSDGVGATAREGVGASSVGLSLERDGSLVVVGSFALLLPSQSSVAQPMAATHSTTQRRRIYEASHVLDTP